MRIVELKNIITEIKTHWISLIVEMTKDKISELKDGSIGYIQPKQK